MIARLWWKEYRQFWPIWVTVALGAALSQWMMLRYWGDDVRNGVLVPAGLAWACLYAIAIGAAAFAGERELKTMVLLDTLPVGRGMLWSGKASFAFLTTFALALVLFGMAAASTDHYDPQYWLPMILIGATLLIAEAIAWGLFWSSLSKSALAAATLALISLTTIVLSPLVALAFDSSLLNAALQRVVVVAITLATSAIVIMSPRGLLQGIRSPQIQLRAPVVVQPIPAREGRSHVSTWESWTTALWRLIWSTIREGRGIYGLLVVIEFVAIGLAILFGSQSGVQLLWMSSVVIGLTAGISVFGIETRAGTQRFLGSHGVRPGAVWLTKIAAWMFGILLLWSPFIVFGAPSLIDSIGRNDSSLLLSIAFAVNGFGIGQLSGMIFRRGITSWFLGIISTIGIMFATGLLFTHGLLGAGWLFAPPVAALVISWAWSGDWIVERPGLGRWIRLGLLVFVAFAVTASSYAAHRVFGVPDFGPALTRQYLQVETTPVAEASNAYPIYLELKRIIDAKPELKTASLSEHPDLLEKIRRASALPACQIINVETATVLSAVDKEPIRMVGTLLADDARKRLESADLAGAWDEILLQFRIARQVGRQAPLTQAMVANSLEEQALRLAMVWSAKPKQTPDLLKSALADYRALPAPAPVDEAIRVEAWIVERTLNLPTESFRDTLSSFVRPNTASAAELFWHRLWLDLRSTPWEMERTRRVCRLLFASEVLNTRLEPRQRPTHAVRRVGFTHVVVNDAGVTRYEPAGNLENEFETTPLARLLMPNFDGYRAFAERLEVDRRALPQILAIRVWQLGHGGTVLESLDDMLKPLNVDSRDPFSGHPFGWVRSQGQPLLPLGETGWPLIGVQDSRLRPTPGSWLLYSVGPDMHDAGAQVHYSPAQGISGDIVYPLPAEPGPKQEPTEPTTPPKPQP
jgi:hypothetical protein